MCNTYERPKFDMTIELKDNAMLKVRPELFDEWDFEKNNDLGLDIYKVTKGSRKKACWVCGLGHEWATRINHRNNGSGCPYCTNQKVLVGHNDMWTTNPKLASLLANPDDGYKYTQGTKQMVDWKCPDCKSILKKKSISQIKNNRLSCSNCGDGLTYPEKFMYGLLKYLDCDFKYNQMLPWSQRKQYDFYIPSLNIIIETHGGQHSGNGFNTIGGRSLKEEQENDKLKRDLAFLNGIEHYIEIDCAKSDFEYIKANILKSKLKDILDLNSVDWISIEKSALTNYVKICCDLYNDGVFIKDISKFLKISTSCVATYLKKGNNVGWCNYDIKEIKKNVVTYASSKSMKKVIQLNNNNVIIKIWNSVTEASDILDIHISDISQCCSGKRYTAGKFKWILLKDYNNAIKKEDLLNRKNKMYKVVMQLDENLKAIREWGSIANINTAMNVDCSSISKACRGKQKTAYGFKWMYKEDYEKYIEEQKQLA